MSSRTQSQSKTMQEEIFPLKFGCHRDAEAFIVQKNFFAQILRHFSKDVKKNFIVESDCLYKMYKPVVPNPIIITQR